jgi:3-oxoacyl-[acyl-carrier protein] reductase
VSTNLADQVALVTGAGSPDGIEFAAARMLAARGARVAITSTTARIHERAAELLASPGASYLTGQSIVIDGGNLLQELKLG